MPKPSRQRRGSAPAINAPDQVEFATLGSVLLAANNLGNGSGSKAEQLAQLEQLRPQMFTVPVCREIFAAMQALREQGHAIDTVTIRAWLQNKRGDLDGHLVTSSLILAEDSCPSAFNFPSYLAELVDKARRRNLLAIAERAKELAADVTLDPAAIRAEFVETLERVSAAGQQQELLRLTTHKGLQAYVPPGNLCLLGENHLTRGAITVLGGPPGCGKSRLITSLAVAGARGKGQWMGRPVNAKFRTLILQAENGLFRLKSEFAAVPDFAEEFIRVSEPPPCGLAFHKPEFRSAVKAALRDFPAELVVIDPWNRVARDEGQKDYLDALESILTCLPQGEAAPAVVIVAHMRKPKTEGMANGRGMLNELSGSLAIGSVARSVFFLLPGSDDVQDDRVVFCCRKNNDGEFGADTAWHRRNGEFAPCADFDFEEFWNPSKGPRREITEQLMEDVFDGGKRMFARNALAEEIQERGFGRTAAYAAINRFKHRMKEKDGLLSWRREA